MFYIRFIVSCIFLILLFPLQAQSSQSSAQTSIEPSKAVAQTTTKTSKLATPLKGSEKLTNSSKPKQSSNPKGSSLTPTKDPNSAKSVSQTPSLKNSTLKASDSQQASQKTWVKKSTKKIEKISPPSFFHTQSNPKWLLAEGFMNLKKNDPKTALVFFAQVSSLLSGSEPSIEKNSSPQTKTLAGEPSKTKNSAPSVAKTLEKTQDLSQNSAKKTLPSKNPAMLNATLEKALYGMSIAQIQLANFNKAQKTLILLTSSTTHNPALYWYTLAGVQLLQGLFNQALLSYNQTIKIRPHFAQAYLNRANTYLQLDQYQQALNNYQQYLQWEPEAPQKKEINEIIYLLRLQINKEKNSPQIKAPSSPANANQAPSEQDRQRQAVIQGLLKMWQSQNNIVQSLLQSLDPKDLKKITPTKKQNSAHIPQSNTTKAAESSSIASAQKQNQSVEQNIPQKNGTIKKDQKDKPS